MGFGCGRAVFTETDAGIEPRGLLGSQIPEPGVGFLPFVRMPPEGYPLPWAYPHLLHRETPGFRLLPKSLELAKELRGRVFSRLSTALRRRPLLNRPVGDPVGKRIPGSLSLWSLPS